MTATRSGPTDEIVRAEQARLELDAAFVNIGVRTRHLSVQVPQTGPATVTIAVSAGGADTIATILAAHAERADQ